MHAKDVAQGLYLTALWLAQTPRAQQLKEAGTELAFPFVSMSSSPFKGLRRSSISSEWKGVKTVIPAGKNPVMPLFMVADDGNSNQDTLAAAVTQVWGIKYGFISSSLVSLVQQFAKVGHKCT